MVHFVFIVLFALGIGLGGGGCSSGKKSDSMPRERFCEEVEKGHLKKAVPLMNEQLIRYTGMDKDTGLVRFRDWLNGQPCVEKARILCYSCIETHPLQSEMNAAFLVKGKKETRTFDVRMGDTLKCVGFHEKEEEY